MAKVSLCARTGVALSFVILCGFLCVAATSQGVTEELMVTDNPTGHTGGRIVVGLRSEPKTLNPVLAADATSREVIRCLTSDLIHINQIGRASCRERV
jgi:hypothetical protein